MNEQQINNLRVGSVIKSKSGKLRVVRNIGRTWYQSKQRNIGDVHSVSVSINRCSRYRRPMTIIDRHSLRVNYDYTAIFIKDVDDDALTKELLRNGSCAPEEQTLYCKDVLDLP